MNKIIIDRSMKYIKFKRIKTNIKRQSMMNIYIISNLIEYKL